METDATKVEKLREQLPATRQMAYLNTGTSGPLPEVAVAAMRMHMERELVEGRINASSWSHVLEAREAARKATAAVAGCTPEEITLTHHTTEGMNIVTWGIDWQPGDEAVTTNVEHAGGLLPLMAVRKARGVKIRYADVRRSDLDEVSAIEREITPRTKLISISHVSYATGALQPLREIVAMAHAHNVPVLVDGAQSAGAIDLKMKELGVDFYSFSGQKWLCGPEDTGALYVRHDKLDTLGQTFVGYASIAERKGGEDSGEELLPHPTAKRFEVGTRNTPAFAGQAAAINWLLDDVGLDWAFARIRALAERTRHGLSSLPGVEILTPANAAGLICFNLEGVSPRELVSALAKGQFVIRWVPQPLCARVATGFFNTEEEIDRLVAAVSAIRP